MRSASHDAVIKRAHSPVARTPPSGELKISTRGNSNKAEQSAEENHTQRHTKPSSSEKVTEGLSTDVIAMQSTPPEHSSVLQMNHIPSDASFSID